MATALASASDPKVKTLAAAVFDTLGDRNRALALAEEVIGLGVIASESNCLAFPRADAARETPRRGKKTGKRPVATDIAELSDKRSMHESLRLSQAGDVEGAKALLPAIRIPRFRWEALFWIAFHLKPPEASQYWRMALLEARLLGREFVELTVTVLAQVEAEAEPRPLMTEFNRVWKQWTVSAFAEQYESLRVSLDSSDARTRKMSKLVTLPLPGMAKAGLPSQDRPSPDYVLNEFRFREPSWTADEVTRLVHRGSPGRRIFALALMRAQPPLRQFDLLTEMVQGSLSAFEQYSALDVLEKVAPTLSAGQRRAVRAMLRKERTRYITPGSDREMLSRRIEAHFDKADKAEAG
jgi:hypothetical protein